MDRRQTHTSDLLACKNYHTQTELAQPIHLRFNESGRDVDDPDPAAANSNLPVAPNALPN